MRYGEVGGSMKMLQLKFSNSHRLTKLKVTQQDWIDMNNRFESDLSQEEKLNFQHDFVLTLHEPWREVDAELIFS